MFVCIVQRFYHNPTGDVNGSESFMRNELAVLLLFPRHRKGVGTKVLLWKTKLKCVQAFPSLCIALATTRCDLVARCSRGIVTPVMPESSTTMVVYFSFFYLVRPV